MRRIVRLGVRDKPPCYETVLLMPPSVNKLYRSFIAGGKVRRALSREATAWKVHALGQLTKEMLTRETLEGRLRLEVRVRFMNRRRQDIQNRLKALCDVMETAEVYLDDSQIDELEVVRLPVLYDPLGTLVSSDAYVSVSIWEIAQ